MSDLSNIELIDEVCKRELFQVRTMLDNQGEVKTSFYITSEGISAFIKGECCKSVVNRYKKSDDVVMTFIR